MRFRKLISWLELLLVTAGGMCFLHSAMVSDEHGAVQKVAAEGDACNTGCIDCYLRVGRVGKNCAIKRSGEECVRAWEAACSREKTEGERRKVVKGLGCEALAHVPCTKDLPEDDPEDTAIVTLHYAIPERWAMLESVCRHMNNSAPFVFLQLHNEPAPEEEKIAIQGLFSNPSCLRTRNISWETITTETWDVGSSISAKGQTTLGSSTYRKMIWFWHHQMFYIPGLAKYKYVMRLDTDSVIRSVPIVDPFKHLAYRKGVYGYVSFCYDPMTVTHGMWKLFMANGTQALIPDQARKNHPHYALWHMTQKCAFDKNQCRMPHPMYYNNFEIVDMDFFRSEVVEEFQRLAFTGIFRYRWGDAPLRAATLVFFADPSAVIHLNTFNYEHGIGPGLGNFPIANTLSTDHSIWVKGFPWKVQGYYGGHCWHKHPTPSPTCRLLTEKQYTQFTLLLSRQERKAIKYNQTRPSDRNKPPRRLPVNESCYVDGVIEGPVLVELVTKGPSECHNMCRARTNCAHFTFVNYDYSQRRKHGQCLLKESDVFDLVENPPEIIEEDGMISGPVTCQEGDQAPSCFLEGGISGEILTSRTSPSREDCASLCANTDDCTHVTFSSPSTECVFYSNVTAITDDLELEYSPIPCQLSPHTRKLLSSGKRARIGLPKSSEDLGVHCLTSARRREARRRVKRR
eukprot:TRINITY_DN42378_c0_g1_i1.p1 TRINITY_DN42378_c0_g1~~TRINITY_DN42378_c0_g1_i1.p1  ORF type:complete len:684 (+),score=37.06 TRINITY_DN42378_c0_g1_i1:33-2084(+)